MLKSVHLIKDDGGDWVRLIVDDHPFYEGHSVPDFVWTELLQRAGVTVTDEEVERDFWEK